MNPSAPVTKVFNLQPSPGPTLYACNPSVEMLLRELQSERAFLNSSLSGLQIAIPARPKQTPGLNNPRSRNPRISGAKRRETAGAALVDRPLPSDSSAADANPVRRCQVFVRRPPQAPWLGKDDWSRSLVTDETSPPTEGAVRHD